MKKFFPAVSALLIMLLIVLLPSCRATRSGETAANQAAEAAENLAETPGEVPPPPEEPPPPPPPPEPPPPVLAAEAVSRGSPPGPEFPYAIAIKAAPPDLQVSLNGTVLTGKDAGIGVKNYVTGTEPGTLRFSAPGYQSQELFTYQIPGLLRRKQLQVKLEKEGGFMELIQEIPTGSQPKSAFFSPAGDRIFVPLLNESGIDVFSFSAAGVAAFEKRLTVPESKARGFVEAMIDERRRDLWVSNMEENRVHVYDLDTLEYKTRANTGGVMPKVITQSPGGEITAVSNWLSNNVSVFDSETKELLYKVTVGGIPRGMAFSPDGGLLYTAIYDTVLIQVIDVAEKKVAQTFRLYEGGGANRHVIYHEGKLFVSEMARGNVCIMDAATGKLLQSKRIGPNINTIVLSPDGKRIFASSRGRNNPEDYTVPGPEFGAVYVLSAEDLSLEEKIWGRNQPTGLAVSPDGRYMVFTDFLDANMEIYRIKQ
jgi:YVTN family beta-propeller protein